MHVSVLALSFALAALLLSVSSAADVVSGEKPSDIAGCATEAGGESAVVEVVDSQTLRLADGRFVRLAGLFVTLPFIGPFAFNASEKAASHLRQIALGRKVAVRYGGRKQDRYGVHLAQVIAADDSIWLQQRLIAEGFALYAPQLDNKACAGELLAAEQNARMGKKGLWKPALFTVKDVRDSMMLKRLAGSFQIVEGRVEQVVKAGSRTLLRFGDGKRTGFAISVSAAARKRFVLAGTDTDSLAGTTIRARGWVSFRSGPLIEITMPEQIERIDAPRR